jgi:hypothetical protein
MDGNLEFRQQEIKDSGDWNCDGKKNEESGERKKGGFQQDGRGKYKSDFGI